jgi:ribosome-associated heat shock protein Hsp15
VTTRIDRWLWAVRLCKSRSQATEACRTGHVRVNGARVKPAATLSQGDRVTARLNGQDRVVEVVRLIDTRVGPPIAVECYVDHTPAVAAEKSDPVARRERGTGRPTKRDRRQIDRWRTGGT